MPVKDVHLVDLHEVERLEEHRLGEEVPRSVDHESSVGEAGPVKNVSCIQQELEWSP